MGSIGAIGSGGVEDHHKASADDGRVKLLCSYGGKILPKPDGQLRYVGGDTRLVSFHRNIGYADLISRLEKLFGLNLVLRYQLPNEDLDTLISATSDEDVENLMEEYHKNESRDGASRLRAFLFPSAGLPPRSSLTTLSAQTVDETQKGPQSQTDPVAPPSPGKVRELLIETQSDAFKIPDYLSCLEQSSNLSSLHGQHLQRHCYSHHHHQQHNHWQHNRQPHQGQQQQFQRMQQEVASSKSSAVPPRFVAPVTKYMQQHTIPMDAGGRGLALTTSALSPLTSSNQHVWDAANAGKEWTHDEHHIDKHPLEPFVEKHHLPELNAERNFGFTHRDGVFGSGMQRAQSKDRILHIDKHSVEPLVEKHNLSEINAEGNFGFSQRDGVLGSGMRRVQSRDRILYAHTEGSCGDGHIGADHQGLNLVQGPNLDEHHSAIRFAKQDSMHRFHKTVEGQRNTPFGMTTSEMQRVLLPQTFASFEPMLEQSIENCQNSRASDEVIQRRVEGYGGIGHASHIHSSVVMMSGPYANYEFQDAMEVHRADNQHQQRCIEFESKQQKREAQIHHLGKAHFQQVQQLHDPPENLQMVSSSHDRVSHNLAHLQRQVHRYQVSSSSNNLRAISWSDTIPHNIISSSMYMQGGVLQSEAQQVLRATNQLQGHVAGNDRYGNQGHHEDEIGYLAPNRAQTSGALTPVDLGDGNGAHDSGAHDVQITQVQYLDKLKMAHRAAVKGPMHLTEEHLQANLQTH